MAFNSLLSSNLEQALDASSIIAVTDRTGKITYVNDRFCEFSKYSKEELVGQDHRIINSGYHSSHFFRQMWKTICSGQVWKGEVKNKAKDGSNYWVDTVIVPFLDKNSRPYQFVSIRNDITRKKLMEEELNQSAERIHAMIQHANEGVAIIDSNFNVCYMSPTYKKITQKDEREVLNQSVVQLIHREDCSYFYQQYDQALMHPQVPVRFQIRARHVNGLYYVHELILTNFYDHPGINGMVINFRDLTEEKKIKQQLQVKEFYDPLTNLPNRLFFKSRLKTMVENRNNWVLAIFNIDDFQHINDIFGHEVGDQLLQLISNRITTNLKKDSFLARIAGDEFALIVPGDRHFCKTVGEKMMDMFKKPFIVNENDIYMTISLGLCHFPIDAAEKKTLLTYTTSSMKFAKEKGKNQYKIFDTSLAILNYRAFLIKNDIRNAVRNHQLEVYFQPRVDAVTDKIVSFESLIRWNHPELGIISPNEFICVAEQNGLMISIGQWVFEESCRKLKIINEKFHSSYKVSINFSVQQLLSVNSVNEYIEMIENMGIPSSFIEIEITESVFIHNKERVNRVINRFREYGFSISLDDFGTGYSSLNYLQEFRTDVLKIDRSFVNKITGDKEGKSIVAMIIKLAHELGMRVVGEGVETPKQYTILKQMGCDEVQGYLYTKPLPFKELLIYLSPLTDNKETKENSPL
ncbi:EAL domain-containing protein [Neobacillus sp. D3-1R]|uniref:sensor domain-containing protein n=1 Tax=Neobacillus sp. D3-1R TaxID=3445778 RepID=UPI003F9EDF04